MFLRKDTEDVTCSQMARYFRRCSDHYPLSDRYIEEVHDSPDKHARTEKKHMMGWFLDNETTGYGSYSRQKGNHSARTCYMHLQNAASLLWIAVVMGVNRETVQAAFDAAVEAGDRRRACGAIRRVIPWDVIMANFKINR